MTLRARDAAPKAVQITLNDTTLDLTTVTGATLQTCTPAGNHVTWAWSIVSATTGQIVLRHVLDPLGADVQFEGEYTVIGTLQAPSGNRAIEPVSFTVDPPPC